MVLLDFSVVPLGQGESVGAQVAECVDIVDRSGLDYRLHAMGTTVEGTLDQVLALLKQCTEAMAAHAPRVSVTAKLDYRRDRQGMLAGKVASVEHHLGRKVKT